MKRILIAFSILATTVCCKAQNAPTPADPCQKLDTNSLKQLILGTWIDVNDTTHTMYFSDDSLVEKINITMNGVFKPQISYWGYKFVDNLFSSDAVTCYSLREIKEDYANHSDVAINSINANYMLMGASGKNVFRKKK